MRKTKPPKRIFSVQVAGWPTRTHRYRAQGLHDPTQVSLTFSGQIEAFAEEIDAELLIVSANPDGDSLSDGPVHIEHWQKTSGQGLRWYWHELRWAWRLLRRARAFRADLVILDSGVLPYFMMALFTLARFPLVVILHNTLWASGFRPGGRKQAVVQAADAWFMRHGPLALIAVSPEAERQVRELAGPKHRPVIQMRAQFLRDYFVDIPPPDPMAEPFRVMFIGRVTPTKGVLDIPDMAAFAERRAPGAVHWTICGKGDAADALREKVAALGLEKVVTLVGWISLEDLKTVYAQSHVSIVPTRSGFAEGLAMTAAEAILAGRVLVSNPIVPALELLRPASLAATANDPESHGAAVLTLAQDRELYRTLQAATAQLADAFYDRELGLTAKLYQAVGLERAGPAAPEKRWEPAA